MVEIKDCEVCGCPKKNRYKDWNSWLQKWQVFCSNYISKGKANFKAICCEEFEQGNEPDCVWMVDRKSLFKNLEEVKE